MAELTPRLPCPVCLGVTMKQVAVGAGKKRVALDWCERCGGVWIERGEVQALRAHAAQSLTAAGVPTGGAAAVVRCHHCHAHTSRDLQRCSACDRKLHLPCPDCGSEMELVARADTTLDVCRRCRGVWFDRHELDVLWRMELTQARTRRGAVAGSAETGAAALADALFWAPDLVFLGAHAAGHALSAGAHAASAAPEALGEAAGVVGEAAGSVFEVIVEIVGGLFG